MYDLYKKIEELCQNEGITINKMCKLSGAAQGSVADLKSGRTKKLSAENISKIAAHFGVSTDYLLGRVDKYGLTDNDWIMMGSAYKTRRILSGKKIFEAVDGELLTEEQLTAFEETGEPLSLEQINTACGLIGTTGPDLFAAWTRNLYKEELPPIVGGQLDENSLEYAAHKYEGDITPEDKATIISLMKRFAEENRKGGGNGATD